MTDRGSALLPVHEMLEALEAWRVEQSDAGIDVLRGALAHLLVAYDVPGVHISLDAPPLPALRVGAGTLAGQRPTGARPTARTLLLGDQPDRTATLEIDAASDAVERMVDALQLTLTAVWARQEARIQSQQLDALDAAVQGIAGVVSVERVLQLIVDRVRDLVEAQYAAMGIVGPFGAIEQFVTSGISDEVRALLGAPPRGHGMLGLIIREDRAFLVDDIASDPRRHGFPPNHPEMHSFLGAPVRSRGRSIGNLYLTNKLTTPTFSEADLRLVERFALHAGIAMENARLHEEIQRLAVVEERERISQDLHDSIIQSLYAISLSLEDLPEITAENPAEGAARADRAIDSIHGTIRDIRNFISGLQPELLEDADLPAGINSLAAEFRANTMIELDLAIADDLPDVPADHAAQILSITREALSNIYRHSRATRASLALGGTDGAVRLSIADNGEGFDVNKPRSGSQRGLANLRSRAEAVGGQLSLKSELGVGTRLVADIPVRKES